MKKILYHGSINIIDKPLYGLGKKYNDYGLGFYTTESMAVGQEWAVSKDQDGYLNKYELDIDDLNILYLNQYPYNVLHWLTILLVNREFDITSILAKKAKEYLISNFSIDLSNYDVVIGYRADDSYFSYAQDFLNGTISLRQLELAMKLGKLGEQVVLISKKAFEKIKFINYEIVKAQYFYPIRQLRDMMARKEYLFGERFDYRKDDIYIRDIIDKEIKEI